MTDPQIRTASLAFAAALHRTHPMKQRRITRPMAQEVPLYLVEQWLSRHPSETLPPPADVPVWVKLVETVRGVVR